MSHALPRGGTFLLACIAGTAIANNYAIQPALTAVAAGLVMGLLRQIPAPNEKTPGTD